MADPIVIYTAGMSDIRFFDRSFVTALRGAGLRVLVNQWCRSWWPLKNLRDRGQHRDASDQLAAMIDRLRESEGPDAPIVPIGHSTGCLITLETLAELDRPMNHALLLAAAVRPDYDLRPALRGVRRIDHFFSYLDPACGVGTIIAGTADGQYRSAAGAVGFCGPGADDPAFVQHTFDTDWLALGHIGGHTTCLAPRFVRAVLLPLLRDPESASSQRPDTAP